MPKRIEYLQFKFLIPNCEFVFRFSPRRSLGLHHLLLLLLIQGVVVKTEVEEVVVDVAGYVTHVQECDLETTSFDLSLVRILLLLPLRRLDRN